MWSINQWWWAQLYYNGDVNVINSYYYCYYAVVVIMLCVLEYAVLRSVTGHLLLSSVAKPDG